MMNNKTEFDLIAHIERQRKFSLRTFGPGASTTRILDHIRKELAEIEANPGDVTEWIDVMLLALDGAWRTGTTSEAIAEAIHAKQQINESRQWPDWQTADGDKAIEHIRDAQSLNASTDHVKKIEKNERDEDKRDARRYRFIRDNIQKDHDLPGGFYLCDEGGISWDKTIDAAMAKDGL
jgi:hypothetical protein